MNPVSLLGKSKGRSLCSLKIVQTYVVKENNKIKITEQSETGGVAFDIIGSQD